MGNDESLQYFKSILRQGQEQSKHILDSVPSLNPDQTKRTKRIMAEVDFRSLCNEADGVGLLLTTPDISNLLGIISGPPFTPHEGGIFYVQIQIPEEYPQQAPKCRFLTKLYHPQVDANGNSHLNVLEDSWWSPMCNLFTVLLGLRSFLAMPETEDALVPDIAKLYLHERDLFLVKAREWTGLYAKGDSPAAEVVENVEEGSHGL